uniref:Large ribosomal subunit protein uL15/eL18 domain-containing protein n=1 Tax=Sus scrofa TaxID=9823 RepID=A0A8D0VBY0_PIG
MGVDNHHDKDQKERFIPRNPRARTSTRGCWSSCTGFWPDEPTPPRSSCAEEAVPPRSSCGEEATNRPPLSLSQIWPLDSPKDCGTLLLSGPPKGHEVCRRFSKAPGTLHGHTKPCVRAKGRKFECARGQCASRSYKN